MAREGTAHLECVRPHCSRWSPVGLACSDQIGSLPARARGLRRAERGFRANAATGHGCQRRQRCGLLLARHGSGAALRGESGSNVSGSAAGDGTTHTEPRALLDKVEFADDYVSGLLQEAMDDLVDNVVGEVVQCVESDEDVPDAVAASQQLSSGLSIQYDAHSESDDDVHSIGSHDSCNEDETLNEEDHRADLFAVALRMARNAVTKGISLGVHTSIPDREVPDAEDFEEGQDCEVCENDETWYDNEETATYGDDSLLDAPADVGFDCACDYLDSAITHVADLTEETAEPSYPSKFRCPAARKDAFTRALAPRPVMTQVRAESMPSIPLVLPPPTLPEPDWASLLSASCFNPALLPGSLNPQSCTRSSAEPQSKLLQNDDALLPSARHHLSTVPKMKRRIIRDIPKLSSSTGSATASTSRASASRSQQSASAMAIDLDTPDMCNHSDTVSRPVPPPLMSHVVVPPPVSVSAASVRWRPPSPSSAFPRSFSSTSVLHTAGRSVATGGNVSFVLPSVNTDKGNWLVSKRVTPSTIQSLSSSMSAGSMAWSTLASRRNRYF